jgi:RNase P subunit RPR2
MTSAAGLYPYRAYLETLLTYGSDAASSHLTNAFWYLDNGNTLACDPTAQYTDDTNMGFVARWNRIKQSKEVELYGRLHSDICNNPTHLLPGVRMQIKLTKARRTLYLMNKDADSKVEFKFQDAQLLVNRVRPNPAYLLAHNTTLQAGGTREILLDDSRTQDFHFL